MVDPLGGGASGEHSGLGELLAVALCMVAPIPIIVVLVGPSREVLLAVFGYAVFLLLAAVITGLLAGTEATSDAASE